MILRRFIPNALELGAANAHDRHPDFIMKLRITFHCSARLRRPIDDAKSRAWIVERGSLRRSLSISTRRAAPLSHRSAAVKRTIATRTPPPKGHRAILGAFRKSVAANGA
jgi:hypothetical protein